MFNLRAASRRLGTLANTAWQMAGITIAIIVAADLGAALLLPSTHKSDALGSRETQVQADGGAKWADELYREESQLSDTWYPYVYWRSSPFEGQYLHVGADGLRFTSNSAPTPGKSRARPFKIFMFGGSTMFGLGARDEDTIPSLLAKALQHDGITNVQITNFGQIGYVSTQEVLALSQQLRLGDVPDLVIFYDGINDAAASYQNGVAGVPQNEFNRAREFNILNQADPSKRKTLYAAAAIVFLNHTALGELSRMIATRYMQPLFNFIRNHLPYNRANTGIAIRRNWETGNDPAALSKLTVDSYLENMRLVEVEGKELGFTSLFYWQPVIYSKQYKSALEQNVAQAADKSAPGMEKSIRATYLYARTMTESTGSSRINDISTIFDGIRDSCFVDLFHITGNCNAIVAARMEHDVRPLVERADSQAEARQIRQPAPPTKSLNAPSGQMRSFGAAKHL